MSQIVEPKILSITVLFISKTMINRDSGWKKSIEDYHHASRKSVHKMDSVKKK